MHGRDAPYPASVRCYVEPSPAGGYFVRLRGEAAPLSHHDTEEEADAAAAAYERGLVSELVVLDDGAEVLVRALRDEEDHDHGAIGAFADGAAVGVARYVRDVARPHVARATVELDDVWRGRGLSTLLLTRLAARAAENGIREFV